MCTALHLYKFFKTFFNFLKNNFINTLLPSPKNISNFFQTLIRNIRKEMGGDVRLLFWLYIYNFVKSRRISLPFSLLMFPSFIFFSSNFWKTKKKNNIYFFQTLIGDIRKEMGGDAELLFCLYIYNLVKSSSASLPFSFLMFPSFILKTNKVFKK